MEALTRIWNLYEKGLSHHRRTSLIADTEKAWRFYEGDQWRGLEDGDTLPIYNVIAPTVRYKVASTAMNLMQIYFSPLSADAKSQGIARRLNALASVWWERIGMDTLCRKALTDSAVAGEGYLLFYNAKGDAQLIDNVNVFLGDESEAQMSRQPYIIISERRSVAEVRALARATGCDEQELLRITADHGETLRKNTNDEGQCTVLLYMEKKGEDLHFVRATRQVMLGQEQVIKGLGCYPLVSLVMGDKKGSARGRGEVLPLINNQIEINRNLVRRILNAKMTAFSRLVYATDKIDNPEALDQVGSAIAVNDSTIADIHAAVGYVTPSPMSSDAKLIGDEMVARTRELAGVGETLAGNVDPTLASGAAIIAVRDQAQIPLNETMAKYRRFVEDIARVWYHLWVTYFPMVFGVNENDFTQEELRAFRPMIRVDATSTTPFSKYAREQTLERLFDKQMITLEEYVEALDDDSSAPKAKLLNILKKRKENGYGEITDE